MSGDGLELAWLFDDRGDTAYKNNELTKGELEIYLDNKQEENIMSELTFEKFPKIHRLKRECVITEKIDGTNAQIVLNEEGAILAGSRNRIITPEDDNYGFAAWAYSNKEGLFSLLGKGRHYGEWWGSGIQRRYGLDNGDKRFSLFNTIRWTQDDPAKLLAVPGLHCVPVLYQGMFTSDAVDLAMLELHEKGSVAAAGFNNPEGVVVYHCATKQLTKTTFEYDKTGKPTGA